MCAGDGPGKRYGQAQSERKSGGGGAGERASWRPMGAQVGAQPLSPLVSARGARQPPAGSLAAARRPAARRSGGGSSQGAAAPPGPLAAGEL